ncbi:MAG: MFS transporter [Oscillospiraceae bacterium]|nr:MFS transporter [Oscillospiraceae bacterium]
MPKSIPWLYFFQNIGMALGTSVPMYYLMYFLTDYAGITPAIVATILLISRVADFAFALIAGPIVQKSNIRWGKYRSWILISVLLVQIGVFMMFINPDISLGAKAIIVCIGYILQNAPMNSLITALYGMMANITGSSMENRMAISAKVIQGMRAATIIVSAVTLPFINYVLAHGVNGFLIVSMIYGATMLISSLVVFVKTKEFDTYGPSLKNVMSVSVGQMYGQTLRNSQLWVVLIANSLSTTAILLIASLGIYYFQYSVDNVNMQPVSATILAIVACVASFVMAPVAKKIGKRNSAITSALFGTVCMTLIGLFAHQNVWFYIAVSAVLGFGAALVGVVGVNLFLDAAEYQLYKTGKDSRAFVMSLYNIPMKVGLAVSSPIAAFLLTHSGYKQEIIDGTLTTYILNPHIFVRWLGLLLAAIYLGGLLLYTFLYKITDAKAAEYVAENQRLMT